MKSGTWNPRYLAFLREHGHFPTDSKPGGPYYSRVWVWVDAMLGQWRRDADRWGRMSDADHDAFDAWLMARSHGEEKCRAICCRGVA